MIASWPMVFGALVAGLIAGFLIPDIHQKPAPSSVVTAKTSVKAPEITKTVETKAPTPAPAKDTPAPAPKTAATEDCERQTWPYLTPNCLDRSVQAAVPDVVVKTKLSEPTSAIESEPTQSPPAAAAPATTASTPPNTASAPAAKPEVVPATKNTAAEPAPVPKTDTPATPKSANPAPNEVKQEPARAAAPAAEKTARRPAPRARAETRAEVQDEPPPARAERYRGERRYAGQLYDNDGPVYIERGGRLYLAPEYQYRLRGPDRYWREW